MSYFEDDDWDNSSYLPDRSNVDVDRLFEGFYSVDDDMADDRDEYRDDDV